MNRNSYIISALAFTVITVFAANVALAFIGPSTGQTPGSGGGLFQVDANRNIGFGTSSSTPISTFNSTSTESGSSAFGYVFTVASTTNPGLSLKNLTSGNTYVWSSRNFGNLQLYRESATLPGYVVIDINQYGDVAIGQKATSTGGVARLYVGGNVQTTGAFVGSVSGALGAGNVSSGVFGSLQGNGNFAFPAALAVGTSTTGGLPTEGLYVKGNVGIGTTSPGNKLTVYTTGQTQVDIDAASANQAILQFKKSSVDKGRVYVNSSNVLILQDSIAADTVGLQITGGNVGIGTAAPSEVLDIRGSTTAGTTLFGIGTDGNLAAISVKSPGTLAGSYNANQTGVLNIGAATIGDQTYSIRARGGATFAETLGNVGIATTTPAYTLDVAGTGRFTDQLTVPTPTAGTSAATKSYVDSAVGGGGAGSFTTLTSTATTTLATSGGYVGIGTVSPTYKLDVNGSVGFRNGAGGYDGFNFDPACNGNAGCLTTNYLIALGIQLKGAQNLIIGPGSGTTVGVTIRSTTASGSDDTVRIVNGLVGIGTTDPGDAKLRLYANSGTTNFAINSADTSTYSIMRFVQGATNQWELGVDPASGGNKFYISGSPGGGPSTDGLVIQQSGNVGIATTTPSYKLDVVGTAQFSQPVIVGTPTANSHAATKSYVDSATVSQTGWTLSGTNVYLTSSTNSVGIGTTGPVKKLDVRGELQVAKSDGTALISLVDNTSGGILYVREGGGTANVVIDGRTNQNSYINTGGNVGIATTTPAAKLSVVGDAILYGASGNISAGVYYDRSNSSYYLDPGANENAYSLTVAGSVGIGTTAPGTPLDVAGKVTIRGNGGVGTAAQIGSNAGTAGYQLYSDTAFTTGAKLEVSSLNVGNNYGASFTGVASFNGNVGIGTSTPAGKLHVFGGNILVSSGYSVAAYETGAGKSFFVGNSADLYLRASGNPDITILQASGNVGIATTTPSDELTVFGDVRISKSGSALIFPDGTTQTSASVGGGGYWSLSGVNLYPTSTTYKAVIGGTIATSSLSVIGDATLYGASGNISAGVYYDRSNTAYYLDPGANENAYSLTTAGNIGVATTTPASKLSVVGNIYTSGHIFGQSSLTSNTIFLIGVNGIATDGFVEVGDNTGGRTNGIKFYPGTSAPALTITSSSNVGVGTATPGVKLDVVGSIFSRNILRVGYGSSNTIISYLGANDDIGITGGVGGFDTVLSAAYSGSGLALASNNTARLYIQNNGNVGIATTTPAQKLEVVGSIKISGSGNALIFPDGTTQTSASVGGGGYWSLSGTNLYPTSTTYKVAIGSTVATSSLTVTGDGIFYGASGNISAGVYYDRSNTAYYLDPGANENAYSLTTAGNIGVATTTPGHALTIAGAYYSNMVERGSLSGNITIDWNSGNTQHIRLTGNATTTFTNGKSGGRYTLVIKQDATGSRLINWPSSVRWSGPAPTLSTTANATDYVGFIYNGVDGKYDGIAINTGF